MGKVMTTRSLILSPHEVRAALADTLGLVVRPVKGIGINAFTSVRLSSFNSIWGPDAWIFETPMDKEATGYEAMSRGLQCPLGVPGDRLIGKETWAEAGDFVGWDSPKGKRPQGVGVIAYRVDNELRQYSIMLKEPEEFKATDLSAYSKLRWRSPATMPAWASRITLEVVGVRCVRAPDLTDIDAELCGVQAVPCGGCGASKSEDRCIGCLHPFYLDSLKSHWTAKYATRYPWETSWAWAVEVRRVEG